MRSIVCFALLSFTLALTSCDDSTNGKESKMKAVIAVHDELMPKMVEITRLEEQLSSTIPDSNRTKEQREVINDLGQARDAMMSWMQDFGQAFDFEEITQGKPLTDAKKDSLDKYSKTVLELQDQMLNAIARGQETFDALKQE